MAGSKQMTDQIAEPRKFSRQAPTKKKSMTGVVQAEAWGDAQRPVRREVPGRHGRQVVRSVLQTETVAVAETPIHLYSDDEVFRAEITALGGGFELQRATGAQRVAELPRIV